MAIITAQAPLPTTPIAATTAKQIDTIVPPVSQEVTEETKKEPSLTPQHVALARKEKAIREQMRAVQAEREAIQAEKAEMVSLKSWKAKLAQEPLSVLTEAGVTYDQLTQSLLNSPQANPEIEKLKQELRAEIKAAQDSIADQSKAQEQAKYEQVKKQILSDVTLLVDGDEAFDMIKSTQSQNAVVELIEEHFKENGVILSLEDAAKEVEEYLLNEAYKMAQYKKVQAKLNPKPIEPTPAEKSPPPQKASPTLTNRVTPSSTKPTTAKERRERAIAAFMGQKLT